MKPLVALVLACAVACGDGASAPTGRTVRLALNWFPESEHGGYFAAIVHGLYREAGLAMDVHPGGPRVAVIPRVASREVELGVVNADDVVAAGAAGAAVVALLAPIHRSPWCVMVHEASGIHRLADLHDLTLAMQAGSPYLAWLQRHAPLSGVHIVPYSGTVAEFLVNPRYAQQAYVFSEPILAAAEGGDPLCLPITELGFDPYASVLVTSDALLRADPELVRGVVEASARGWARYVDDPGPTNAHILARNPEIGRDALDRGAAALRPLVLDDDARQGGVGSMRAERWQTLVAQMRELGMVEGPLDGAALHDGRFVPRPAQ
ncbi:MAG TPA: ABC transporter substrate-binding protein [Candidatus Eisenbacteria bacterium]|nr:ABC transporter substrate-binding protein [Candidatus Eisenbacteria bacterium]